MTPEQIRPGHEVLAAFAKQAQREEQDPDDRVGVAMDIDAALNGLDEDRFRDLQSDRPPPVDERGALVFELEWIGPGMAVADVDRDFYQLLGFFAEEAQFVHRTVTGEEIVYDLVTGSLDPPHSHRLRFRLRGDKISRVAQGYQEFREPEPR